MQQTIDTEGLGEQLEKLKQQLNQLEQKTNGRTQPEDLPAYKKVEMVGNSIGLNEDDYTDSSDKYYKRPNAEGWDKIFKLFRGNVEGFEY